MQNILALVSRKPERGVKVEATKLSISIQSILALACGITKIAKRDVEI
jgi:hypothetical protein